MDAPPEDLPPSLLKNATAGSGCGCGCLGLLLVLVAAVGLVAIPLEMYAEGPGNAFTWGVIGVVCGLLISALGGTVWIASFFMD